jgi:cell division protein FtsL
MNTEVITTEFADQWPLQPWASAVRTAAVADAAQADAPTWAPSGASPEAEALRSQRDRGASAVEWVVITAIVVAIVSVVGGIIFKSVQKKANDTDKQIQDVNPITGATS